MSNQKLPPPPIPSQMHNGRSSDKQMVQPVNGRVPTFSKPTNLPPDKPPSSSTSSALSGNDVEKILKVMTSKIDLLTSIAPTPRNELIESQLPRAPIYAELPPLFAPIIKQRTYPLFVDFWFLFFIFRFLHFAAVLPDEPPQKPNNPIVSPFSEQRRPSIKPTLVQFCCGQFYI